MTTHPVRSSRGTRDINHIAPATYDKLDVEAIKAVAAGNASAGQQKRALAWIVNQAARIYDEPFVPGAPDVCAHLTGRMNVGRQILKLVNTPVHLLTNERNS